MAVGLACGRSIFRMMAKKKAPAKAAKKSAPAKAAKKSGSRGVRPFVDAAALSAHFIAALAESDQITKGRAKMALNAAFRACMGVDPE